MNNHREQTIIADAIAALGPAWKVRLRNATDVEINVHTASRDDESGIVSEHAIALPNDVSKARNALTRDALYAYGGK